MTTPSSTYPNHPSSANWASNYPLHPLIPISNIPDTSHIPFPSPTNPFNQVSNHQLFQSSSFPNYSAPSPTGNHANPFVDQNTPMSTHQFSNQSNPFLDDYTEYNLGADANPNNIRSVENMISGYRSKFDEARHPHTPYTCQGSLIGSLRICDYCGYAYSPHSHTQCPSQENRRLGKLGAYADPYAGIKVPKNIRRKGLPEYRFYSNDYTGFSYGPVCKCGKIGMVKLSQSGKPHTPTPSARYSVLSHTSPHTIRILNSKGKQYQKKKGIKGKNKRNTARSILKSSKTDKIQGTGSSMTKNGDWQRYFEVNELVVID